MVLAMMLIAVPCSVAAGTNETVSVVDMKPLAISLKAPPVEETVRSCVLRGRAGKMRILSAAASDPAITVDVREYARAGTHIVTATLPAGYRTPHGKHAEIRVRTDLEAKPLIHIPVRVWNRPISRDSGWLAHAETLIGKPLPTVVTDRPEGGELTIEPAEGQITVVVFSAHWCGHCDIHVPVLERVWKDYREYNVKFLGVAGAREHPQRSVDAAGRWEIDWPWGVDRGTTAVRRFGVMAFPVVFVAGFDGTVEAVHGRHANTDVDNGLDDLDLQLRTELDILLGGGTRADFPDWETVLHPPVTTRPASTRPDRPVLKVEARVQGKACKPGESISFQVPVRNVGMKPLELRKVEPDEGVSIRPACVAEVAPGGVAVLHCQVGAPEQPGDFSRRIAIETNPFRFSSKHLDTELAGNPASYAIGNDCLYYYGHRYYSPTMGRWISRDPIEEIGFSQLIPVSMAPDFMVSPYSWLQNDGINSFDAHGLLALYSCNCPGEPRRVRPWYSLAPVWMKYKCDWHL